MTAPTNNPIPSNSVQDRLYNAEKFDEFMNSDNSNYTDRKGKSRWTLSGIRQAVQNWMDLGIPLVALEQGGTAQDVLTEIPAAKFGVTGDGVACGAACVTAIEYIMTNGGTLVFPKGEVNWGTTRPKFTIYNGKACTIRGADGGTTWTFDNVDPVANASGSIWPFSEPFLIEFGGQPTTQGVFVEPVTVENLTIDYTRQVNKGGPTYQTMGVGAHPTPYSDGTLGLRFSYCRSPIVRNVTMKEIYGSGIQFWKCSMALAENNYLYNVSANQP